MELIDREQAIKALEDLHKNKQTIDAIKNLPIIESRPKGRWGVTSTLPRRWECSHCGTLYDDRLTHMAHNFCTVCGADMRVEE